MKKLKLLYEYIEDRKDFSIINKGFDGGAGIFTKGSMKGMTVIWSYSGGWEHVSINGINRTPTWEEMCILKDMFWEDDEAAVQYHPPKSDYVNNLNYCLHIWRPIKQYSGDLPLPPSSFVGSKERR